MDSKFAVNIGCQLGSDGREVGGKLAVRLGIDFYGRELANLASEGSGPYRKFFEKADEKASQGVTDGSLGVRFPFISDGAMPVTNCLSNGVLFKVQSGVIRKLASEKSCLFVGRCAGYILRNNPHCVNAFTSSSREDRITRLYHLHSIPEDTAEEKMNKADKQRMEYYNCYGYKTWGATATYRLCIDSSALGIDETVNYIEEFMKKKLKL